MDVQISLSLIARKYHATLPIFFPIPSPYLLPHPFTVFLLPVLPRTPTPDL
jgi:hypothetical protein